MRPRIRVCLLTRRGKARAREDVSLGSHRPWWAMTRQFREESSREVERGVKRRCEAAAEWRYCPVRPYSSYKSVEKTKTQRISSLGPTEIPAVRIEIRRLR